METAAECLKAIVTLLVDKPEQVKIEESSDEMGVLFRLHVAQEDMGKVIGKAGNTAKALRSIIRVVGMKNGARVSLRIEDPNQENEKHERQDKGLDESLNDLDLG